MMEQVLFQVVLYGQLVTKEWLKPLQQVQVSLTSWPTSLVVLEIPSQLLIVLEILLQQRQQRLHSEMWSLVLRV